MPALATPEVSNLDELLKQLNLTKAEYNKIKTHLNREPNFTEIAMFSVLWSEHCCYKNSRHLLKKFPGKGPRVLAGAGENAGVIDLGDGIQVAFKIESHNHPTAVEPYQGATTGVGGILRDIFTMNARPIANLNSLRFGPQTDKHNKFLFTHAVKGIGDYGNCVGVPTIAGEVFFDESYSGNPLVNAMAIGVIYDSNITSAKAHGIGNPVLYVGNRTGRDGMGGAAFASRELDEKSHQDRPAVQVGDPFCEKLLIEACLEAFATGCVVAAQDMGAAGLTSSSCEMAAKGGIGMHMDLDLVPAREPGMLAHEYMLSESQERMLFVLEKGKEQPVLDVFKKWHLEAAVIGETTPADKDGVARIEVYRYGEKVVDLPAMLLTDLAPSYDPGIHPKESDTAKALREKDPVGADIQPAQIGEVLTKLIGAENIAQPKQVFEQYDRHVQNSTMLASENLSSGVIQLRDKHGKYTNKAIAATVDCNARFVGLEPYSGAMSAVAEAARNLVCVGATPLAVTDNLNFGNPEKPEIYYQLYYSVEGIKDACLHFETPVISGNVSLYNEHSGSPILPAPVIGMVGMIEGELKTASPAFKKAGQKIALLGRFKPTLGGSEYQRQMGINMCGAPPDVSLNDEKQLHAVILKLIQSDLVASVQDVSMGGLLTTITEALFANNLGAQLEIQGERLDNTLFGETNGSYVISYDPEQEESIRKIIEITVLGETTTAPVLKIKDQSIDLVPLKQRWTSLL